MGLSGSPPVVTPAQPKPRILKSPAYVQKMLFALLKDQKQPLPFPQQQRISRSGRILSHPEPLKKEPLPFPQQHSNRRIQIRLPHPLSPLPHSHPQFVAAKSLIFEPPLIFVYSS